MILPLRRSVFLLRISLGILASFLIACGGGGNMVVSSSAQSPAAEVPSKAPALAPSSTKIRHVIVIVQENRTPDNLFHGLPNADIANSGMDSSGAIVPLT